MFLVRWFYDVLSLLGLGQKEAKILFLGLDNAGKTALLHMLKDEGRVLFRAFDLGGHRVARRVWRDYYAKVDVVVFVVDAADGARLAEARAELGALLADDALAGAPFLVLGNKVDLPHAASERDLCAGLGLVDVAGGVRPVEVFMCSVVRRMGYGEGFRWMSQHIK